MRYEGSQDIASFNPILVFAADCLISSACFYSDKCSKSLTRYQYHLNSLQIFLVYWKICIDFDFYISDSNKISKTINFIFGIFSYVSKNPQRPRLTIVEAFLSIGKWQDFYQQNARLKIKLEY